MTGVYFIVKVFNPSGGWGTDKHSWATSYDSAMAYDWELDNQPPYIPSCQNIATPFNGDVVRCMTPYYTTSNPEVVWQLKVNGVWTTLPEDADNCVPHRADNQAQCKEFKAIVWNRMTDNTRAASSYVIFYCIPDVSNSICPPSICPGNYAIFDPY